MSDVQRTVAVTGGVTSWPVNDEPFSAWQCAVAERYSFFRFQWNLCNSWKLMHCFQSSNFVLKICKVGIQFCKDRGQQIPTALVFVRNKILETKKRKESSQLHSNWMPEHMI